MLRSVKGDVIETAWSRARDVLHRTAQMPATVTFVKPDGTELTISLEGVIRAREELIKSGHRDVAARVKDQMWAIVRKAAKEHEAVGVVVTTVVFMSEDSLTKKVLPRDCDDRKLALACFWESCQSGYEFGAFLQVFSKLHGAVCFEGDRFRADAVVQIGKGTLLPA